MPDKTELIEKQKLLLKLSSKYFENFDFEVDFQQICDDARELTNAPYVVFNLFVPENKTTKTIAVSGVNANFKKAAEIFGFSIIGKEWELDSFAIETMKTTKLVNKGEVDSATKSIKKVASKALKKVFNIGDLYSIGISKDNIVFGTLVFILNQDEKINHTEIVEIFTNQIANHIYRAKTEKALVNEKNNLIKAYEQQNRISYKLDQFQNSINDALIISKTDEKGNIIYINSNFLKICGYSTREIIGKKHTFISGSYHPAVFWKDMWQHISNGLIWRGEIKNRKKNKDFFWADTTIIPILNYEGEITEYLSIRNDITTKKNAEKELENITEQLTSVLNTINDIVWSVEYKTDKLIYVNKAIENLTGYKVTDFVSNHKFWNTIIHPDDLWTIEHQNTELNKNDFFEIERRIVCKQGQIKFVFEKQWVKRDSDNNILKREGIITDITERKKNEIELKKRKEFITSIVNTLPDLIFRINKKLIYTYCHAVHETELYAPLAEIVGKSIYDLLPHELAIQIQRNIEKVFKQGNLVSFDYQLQINGLINWYEARISKIDNNEVLCIIRDISKRKKTEEELLNNQKKLLEAEKIAKSGHWELDIINNELIWSDSIYEIFEIEKNEFGATFEAFMNSVHPDDREMVGQSYADSLKNKTDYEITHRLLLKFNRVKWIKEACNTIYNQEGIPVRSIGIVQDITKEKQAELDLLQTKDLLDQTTKLSRVGGWEVDLQTSKIYWSEITKEIHKVPKGYKPNLRSALNFYKEGIHRENITEAFNNCIFNGISFEVDAIIEINNSELWIKVIGNAQFENGKCIKVFGTIQDIDKIKKAELIILQQNNLQQLIAEISSLFVKSTYLTIDSVINETLKRCATFYNIERCFLFLIDEQNATMSNTNDYTIDGIKSYKQQYQNVFLLDYPWFAKKIPFVDYISVSDVEKLDDEANAEKAGWIHQEIKSILIVKIEQNNKPLGVIGFASITHVRNWTDTEINSLKVIGNILSDAIAKSNFEKEAIEAKENAEQASKFKTEFLSNMSHEIRTPLNAVLGFSQLLKGNTINEKYEDYVSNILKGGNNLLLLINDILDLSKIEAGKIEITKSVINFQNLLYDFKSIFSQKEVENNILFEIIIDESFINYIEIDEIRIRQILFNLLGNAFKFTQNGSIILKLTVININNINNTICFNIEIIDQGIGIANNYKELIFENFVQQSSQNNSKYGGSGLGLAITKKLVEVLGGTISVESEIGIGSNFKVEFCDIKFIENYSENVDSAKIERVEFLGQKILLVEDVKSNRDVVKGYLENFNLKIEEAENGLEALNKIKIEKPDLILLDIMMPLMGGRETIIEIKKNPKYTNIPIIALTAFALKQNEVVIKDLCDAYLRKPIDRDGLISSLKLFLEHKKIENTNVGNKLYNKVIVAEDDELSKKIIADVFKLLNIEAVIVGDGEQLIEECLKDNYDCILIDINLPNKNGFEVANELKQIYGFKTPIFALTANSSKQIKEQARAVGIEVVLEKPINLKYFADFFQVSITGNKENILEQASKFYSSKLLLNIADNDFEKVNQWTKVFLNSVQTLITITEQSIKNNDFFNEDLKNNLHKLQSSTMYFGAIDLKEMIKQYEDFVCDSKIATNENYCLLIDILKELENLNNFYSKIVSKNNRN